MLTAHTDQHNQWTPEVFLAAVTFAYSMKHLVPAEADCTRDEIISHMLAYMVPAGNA